MYMPLGSVPWYNEGISALLGGAQQDIFITVPFSVSSDNSRRRSIDLHVSDDFNVSSTVTEKIVGQDARRLRLKLNNTEESSYDADLKKYIKDNYYNFEIDSVSFANFKEFEEPFNLNYKVQFANIENELIGDRILLKPIKYMEKIENPFVENTRTQAIIFDYPYEVHENLTFTFPENMKLEAVPENLMIQNDFGTCGVNFTQVGNMLSVQRIIKMKQSYILAQYYDKYKEFLQQVVNCNDLTVSILYEE